MASFHSGPGQHALTVSSGSSVYSVVDISSSSDSDEARAGHLLEGWRGAGVRPRPSSAHGAQRQPTLAAAAAVTPRAVRGPRRVAGVRPRPSPRRSQPQPTPAAAAVTPQASPRSAAHRLRPSSPASVSVGSSDRGSGDEAISRRKYNKWSHEDEREVLDTMAHLLKVNNGKTPRASLILKELLRKRTFERRDLKVGELSSKMYWLKPKFAVNADKAAANGGKLERKTKYRDDKLYDMSQHHKLWQDVDADNGAAYLQ